MASARSERPQCPEYGDVGLHDTLSAMAVALHDHLEVLVAEEVGDLAEWDVGVDHQRRDGMTHLVQRELRHVGGSANLLEVAPRVGGVDGCADL